MKNLIKFFIILLILSFGVGILILLINFKKPPPEKSNEQLRSIKVQPLTRGTIVPKVAEFAIVKSLEKVRVRAEVRGKIIECRDDTVDGVNVKKDDILLQLEKDDYIIAKQQAEAELEILQAEFEKLTTNVADYIKIFKTIENDFKIEEDNFKRMQKLFDQNVSSKRELERAKQERSRRKKIFIEVSNLLSTAKFSLQSIKAQIKKAKAILDQAELNLKRTTIRASINGRIGDCRIEIGEYLALGEQICTITNDKQPSLQVPLDATEASNILKIYPGTKEWLKIPDTVKVTISWVKKREACKWSAEVTRVENYDSLTDTLRVLVTPKKYIGNQDKSYPLLPGMFCEVKFFGVKIKNAFKIPFSALQFGNNVFTVNKNGILRRHKIEPFAIHDDQVIILNGLPDDEQVVVQQLPRGLLSGVKVKPVSISTNNQKINIIK